MAARTDDAGPKTARYGSFMPGGDGSHWYVCQLGWKRGITAPASPSNAAARAKCGWLVADGHRVPVAAMPVVHTAPWMRTTVRRDNADGWTVVRCAAPHGMPVTLADNRDRLVDVAAKERSDHGG
jgi:hypothetical protein